MQFAIVIKLLWVSTVCYTFPYQLHSKCKIFWKMLVKRNRVLESDHEIERQIQTNSGLTTDNLNLVHL